MTIVWNEDRDVLTDGFRSRVTENLFCPTIPAGDHSIERFADDRVIGRLDNRRKVRARELGSPPFGDVAKYQNDSRQAAACVADRCGAVIDGDLAAVPVDEDRVISQPHDVSSLQN